MFLTLVNSRVSIVRMMSAASRMARVVSLKNAVQSTTTRSCDRRSVSRIFLTPAAVDQLRRLRRGRREEDADAGGVIDHERVDGVELAQFKLGNEVGDGLRLRVQVEEHAHVAELEGRVDDHDLLVEHRRGRDSEVDRHGRATDAALGAENGDDQARLPLVQPGDRNGAIDRRGGGPRGTQPAHLVALASIRMLSQPLLIGSTRRAQPDRALRGWSARACQCAR